VGKISAFLKKNKILITFLLLICFLSVLSPLTFFKGDNLLMGMDGLTPVKPSFRLYDWFHTWSHYSNLGDDSSSRIVNLPTQILPFVIMEKLALSPVESQKIFFIFIFFISGISMFFLSSVLFDNFKDKNLISFIAAIFYMFNPFVGSYWVTFLPEAIFCYAVTPLIVGFFIKGLKSKNYFLSAIIFSLSTLLYPVVNPPMYVIVFMILALFYIYFLINYQEKTRIIKFGLWSIFFFLVVNFWWLMTEFKFYLKIKDYYQTITEQENRLISSSFKASFMNIFRLQGNNYWGFSYWGENPNNFVGFLYETKPFLILSSMIYAIMAFTSFFFSKRKKLVLFLILSTLIFIFLSKGVHPPFETIYKIFYRLPIFNIFRTPSDKFPAATVLLMAPLIGLTFWGIYQFFIKKNKLSSLIFFVLTIAILLLNQWYFFTGDAIHHGKDAQPSMQLKIPDDYLQASNWLSNKEDFFRILNLPGADYPTRWLNYNWGFLGVYPFLPEILQKPVVDKPPTGNLDSVRIALFSSMGNFSKLPYVFLNIPKNNLIYKFLALLNVKEILINKDTDWQHPYYQTEDPNLLEENLKKQENIYFDKSFGNLYFYRIDDKFSLPYIYSPKSIAVFQGDKLSIPLIVSLNDYQFGQSLFEDNQNLIEKNDLFIVPEFVYPIQEKQLSSNFSLTSSFNFEVFPFSRWSPKNPIYRLVSKKEELIKSRTADPKAKLELTISLAGKRISEIAKWRNNFSKNDWLEQLQLYEKGINEAFEIIETLRDDKEYLQTFWLFEGALLSHEEYLLNLAKDRKLADEQREEILLLEGKIFGKFFEKINKIRVSKNYDQAIYKINISVDGFYHFYIRDENFSPFLNSDFVSKLELKIDDSNSQINGNLKNDGWFDMGEIYLSQNQKQISFKMPEANNLIDDKNWQTNSKEIKISDEGIILEKAIVNQLNKNSQILISQKIKNFEPNTLFKISFEYEAKEGNLKAAVLQDIDTFNFPKDKIKGENISPLYYRDIYYGIQEQKRHFETFLRSSSLAKNANFYLIFSPFSANNSSFLVKDIEIKRILEPKIILKQKISDKEIITPQIKFKMINPTKYEVEIQGAKEPYWLIFPETFSVDWQALVENKVIPKERHIVANGYANSWYLKPEDSQNKENYKIFLEYKAQKSLYWNVVISSVGFLGIIIFLFVYYLRRKND
jgi:hypothetical protein